MKNSDFIIRVSPRPIEVVGKYDENASMTVIEIKGLGLYLTLNLHGNHTKGIALQKVRKAVLFLSNNGRLHLAPTDLKLAIIAQLP